jgi:hypothetical protein
MNEKYPKNGIFFKRSNLILAFIYEEERNVFFSSKKFSCDKKKRWRLKCYNVTKYDKLQINRNRTYLCLKRKIKYHGPSFSHMVYFFTRAKKRAWMDKCFLKPIKHLVSFCTFFFLICTFILRNIVTLLEFWLILIIKRQRIRV